MLRKHKIDIIHSQNGCSIYAALAGRLAGVKVIVHTDHGRLVPDKKSAILEDRISSLFFNRFVAVSDQLHGYLASVVKINKNKLATIINGVDTDTFKPLPPTMRAKLRSELGITETDKVIGTVCRLDPIKNLEFLIGSMKSISEVLPKCKLLIVGDGPAREQLMRYTQTFGVASKVMFLGMKQNIEEVLGVFDLYVCTSLSEGTSMTILEAMSCGVPVIVSSVGGNLSIIDEGKNGYLFPLDAPQLLINRIKDLLNDKNKSKDLGEAARRTIENKYDFNNTLKKYTELYRLIS